VWVKVEINDCIFLSICYCQNMDVTFAKNKILTIEAELDLLKRAYAKKPSFVIDETNWKKVKPTAKKIRRKLFAEIYG